MKAGNHQCLREGTVYKVIKVNYVKNNAVLFFYFFNEALTNVRLHP